MELPRNSFLEYIYKYVFKLMTNVTKWLPTDQKLRGICFRRRISLRSRSRNRRTICSGVPYSAKPGQIEQSLQSATWIRTHVSWNVMPSCISPSTRRFIAIICIPMEPRWAKTYRSTPTLLKSHVYLTRNWQKCNLTDTSMMTSSMTSQKRQGNVIWGLRRHCEVNYPSSVCPWLIPEKWLEFGVLVAITYDLGASFWASRCGCHGNGWLRHDAGDCRGHHSLFRYPGAMTFPTIYNTIYLHSDPTKLDFSALGQ